MMGSKSLLSVYFTVPDKAEDKLGPREVTQWMVTHRRRHAWTQQRPWTPWLWLRKNTKSKFILKKTEEADKKSIFLSKGFMLPFHIGNLLINL